MARSQGYEKSGETGEDGGWEECVAVCGQEIQERGEEKASCFFFRRDAQEVRVEDDDVVFTGSGISILKFRVQ
jgi:hypothetical protein